MNAIKVKLLVLVNGDEYQSVTVSNEIPEWIKKNVSDKYLAVTSGTSTVFIDSEMIVSIELEKTKICSISS